MTEVPIEDSLACDLPPVDAVREGRPGVDPGLSDIEPAIADVRCSHVAQDRLADGCLVGIGDVEDGVLVHLEVSIREEVAQKTVGDPEDGRRGRGHVGVVFRAVLEARRPANLGPHHDLLVTLLLGSLQHDFAVLRNKDPGVLLQAGNVIVGDEETEAAQFLVNFLNAFLDREAAELPGRRDFVRFESGGDLIATSVLAELATRPRRGPPPSHQ